MTAARPLLSIVCPAYQEEEVLPLFHHDLAAVLATLHDEYRIEILYVDDGSRDRTLEVLRDLAQTDGRVRYFSLSRNFGHQAALTAGLEQARGDVIVTMDADLQHPPRLIPELLLRWREGHDIVLTIRAPDERLSFLKRFTSKLFYVTMRALSETDIREAASDFRLMSRKALDGLLQLKERHRLLRGMVQWLGYRTAEVHFHPDERKAGHTKYTLRRMLRLAGEGLISSSRVPLRLASYFGMLAIVLGLGHAAWYLLSLLRGTNQGSGEIAYLLISGHLWNGAILCAIGMMGEYLGRVFEQVQNRPLYLIKECTPGEREAVVLTNEDFPRPGRRDAA